MFELLLMLWFYSRLLGHWIYCISLLPFQFQITVVNLNIYTTVSINSIHISVLCVSLQRSATLVYVRQTNSETKTRNTLRRSLSVLTQDNAVHPPLSSLLARTRDELEEALALSR